MNKKILNEIDIMKYLFDYQRGVVISEQKSLSESRLERASMADIMSLQLEILNHEIHSGIAEYIDDPSGCKKPNNTYYEQGEQSNGCKISGTSLCDGNCFQNKAIDGIYGPKTKAAYEKYKTESVSFLDDNNDTLTFEDVYGENSIYSTSSEWGQKMTSNWQIPANMTNIKAFQHYVWKKIESDAEKQPGSCDSNNQNCSYKSILCGNNFCKYNKVVDGYWGPNTKKAWEQYKDKYYEDGYNVGSMFEDMPRTF